MRRFHLRESRLLKASDDSLEVCSIGGIAMGPITLDAHLMASRESLGGRNALPVAVFFGLHFLEGSEFADGFVQGAPISITPGGLRSPFGDAHISRIEIVGPRALV